MVWRLILGPVLIATVVVAFVIDYKIGRVGWPLLVFTLALCIRSTSELVHLLSTRSFVPQMILVNVCSAAIIFSNWFERILSRDRDIHVGSVYALGPVLLTFSLVLLVLLFSQALRYRKPGQSMESLGAEIFIVSYVGILLSMTAQLRWVAGAEHGYFALGSLLAVTKCGDIGAYFVGKAFGRRKLIERLSPGKTRAGAVGAICGAALGSLFWFDVLAPRINSTWQSGPFYYSLIYGICIGVVGLVGDLCESLIKRDVGQKDSASIIPGFGGLLDILDSVIYSAPVAYLLWLVLPLMKN
jgi:phosphatidate cytidylyltransferase